MNSILSSLTIAEHYNFWNMIRGRPIFTVMAVLLGLCSFNMAWATGVRTAGFALDTDLSWMIPGQLPEIYLNPAKAAYFSDNFYLEYTAETGTGTTKGSGGIFLNAFSNVNIGIVHGLDASFEYFNSGSSPRSLFYDLEAYPNSDFRAVTSQTHLDLNTAVVSSNGLALADLGTIYEPGTNDMKRRTITGFITAAFGSLNTGLSAYHAFSSNTKSRLAGSIDESINLNSSETGISAGVFQASGFSFIRSYELRLSHTFLNLNNLYDEIDSSGQRVFANLASDGAGESEIYARADLSLIRSHNFRIRVSYAKTDTSTIAVAESSVTGLVAPFSLRDEFSRSGSAFKIGLADEMRFSSTVMWFVGMQAEFLSLKNEFSGSNILTGSLTANTISQEMSAFTLPVQMGLEATLSEHWQMRLGVGHRIFNRRADGTTYNEVTRRITRNTTTGNQTSVLEITRNGASGALSNAALGFSWIYGRYRADWLANINFVSDGPNFLSGQVNDFSLAVALVYRFDAAAPPEILPESTNDNIRKTGSKR